MINRFALLPVRYALLLSCGLGLSMPLAYAPYSVYGLSCFIWAIILLLIENRSARHSLLLGWVFGLAWFASGIWWISISLSQFGNAPLPFAILATACVIVLMSLYPALFAWLMQRVKLEQRWRYLVFAPALWGGLEWLRSILFTGFPWLALGYSFEGTPVAQVYFPLIGALGSSMLVVFAAGCVVLWFAQVQHARRAGQIMGLGFILISLILFQTDIMRRNIAPTGQPIAVGLVQGNIPQDTKFDPQKIEEALLYYAKQTAKLADKAKVIVWPETAIADFYVNRQDFIHAVRQWARLHHITVITGIASGNMEKEDYRNSLLRLGEGEDQFYDKHRLLPFGEYLPLRSWLMFFRDYVDIPMADFTAGDRNQPLMQAGGVSVGLSICFEAVFGEEMRRFLPDAHYLINVSNDAWFGDTAAPWQHLQIVRARAIELARPVVRATNTGVSAIIDHRGAMLVVSGVMQGDTLLAPIQPMQGLTPYARFGDNIWLIYCALACVLSIYRSMRCKFKQ